MLTIRGHVFTAAGLGWAIVIVVDVIIFFWIRQPSEREVLAAFRPPPNDAMWHCRRGSVTITTEVGTNGATTCLV